VPCLFLFMHIYNPNEVHVIEIKFLFEKFELVFAMVTGRSTMLDSGHFV